MSTSLYLPIQQALSAHWKNHGGKYPQKVILTLAQHQAINDVRFMAQTGVAGKGVAPVAGEKLMGVLIEHDSATPGVMIDVNGLEIPLQAAPPAQ